MKTALVTGGGGFVGSAVVHRLLADGVAVRVLGRSRGPYPALAGLDVEQIEGDICDAGIYQRALKGCDALFHFAADYRFWVPNPDTMYRINVEATRELILAAAESGCTRIIHCSSVAALRCYSDGSIADEESPTTVDSVIGHYKKSKFLAEQEILRLVDKEKVPVVIVNPSAPIGPRDCRPTPTGKMVLDTYCGRMPAYINTGINVVHVDDVADGTLLAWQKGRCGERYILGGDNMMLVDILAAISKLANRKPPRIQIPAWALAPVALIMEASGRLFNFEPVIYRDVLRMARKIMYFSSEKAQRELGYRPRPAIHALADSVSWFYRNGYCGPKASEPVPLPANAPLPSQDVSSPLNSKII